VQSLMKSITYIGPFRRGYTYFTYHFIETPKT